MAYSVSQTPIVPYRSIEGQRVVPKSCTENKTQIDQAAQRTFGNGHSRDNPDPSPQPKRVIKYPCGGIVNPLMQQAIKERGLNLNYGPQTSSNENG